MDNPTSLTELSALVERTVCAVWPLGHKLEPTSTKKRNYTWFQIGVPSADREVDVGYWTSV